jgi:hypothetical protein
MAENKTKETLESVDDFIAKVLPIKRRDDAVVMDSMMQAITGKQPKMWGKTIIGYGSVHYKYATGREGDWPLIGFAPRKTSLSLYLSMGDLDNIHAKRLAKLGKHKTGAGCLYINKLEDVDLAVLNDLLKESVDHNKAQWG